MMTTMSNTTTTRSNKGSRRSNNNCGGTDDDNFTQSVISTADTAILSKLSCVEYGYYQDPFLHAMACGARGLNSASSSSTAASASSGGVGRIGRGGCCGGSGGGGRAGCGRGGSTGPGYTIEPIIRRGTHARVKAIERAIDAFLSLTFSSAEKSEGNQNDDDGMNNRRNHHQQRQIVILGSGRDTNYLRYMYGDKMKSLGEKEEDATKHQGTMKDNVRWYEVDHLSVVSQKARDWLPNCLLPHGYTYRYNAVHDHNHDAKNDKDRIDDDASYAITILPPKKININGEEVESNSTSLMLDSKQQPPPPTTLPNYHLIGHDLRSDPSQLFEKLSRPNHGYDKSCPTLFVLECVLMYLPECSIRELLRCIAESPCDSIGSSSTTSASTSSSFVAIAVYDPIPSHDRFGRTMIDNLHKAGITSAVRDEGRELVDESRKGTSQVLDNDNESNHWHLLLGLEGTRTLSDQLSRLVHSSGFDIAVGCDMMSAYNYGVISEEERRVAARCEMLDELEEFVLLMEHYCFVMGVVFPCSSRNNKTGLLGDHDNTQSRFCVAERLCSVGVDSLIGFREGNCTIMRSDR